MFDICNENEFVLQETLPPVLPKSIYGHRLPANAPVMISLSGDQLHFIISVISVIML